jgi:hypothetical protein
LVLGWISDIFSHKYHVGYSETFSLGFGIKLIFKNEYGWHIWKVTNCDMVSHFLCKPASGVSKQPKPKGLAFINEGNGFYCVAQDYNSEQYFSFYGSDIYRGRGLCQFKGKFYASLNREIVLDMNDSVINFEVTSSPNQLPAGSSGYSLESGSVDMTGFKEALVIFDSKTELPLI